MTKKINNIQNFPLERFKNNWPFDRIMLADLFYMNSYQPYSSLKEFLFEEYGSNFDEYLSNGIFIEDNQTYYEDLDNKIYTLENISYSFLVCNAIKYELTLFSEPITATFYWKGVLSYLMFTTFPVIEILEEEDFIKNQKKDILNGFYKGFNEINRGLKTERENFVLTPGMTSCAEQFLSGSKKVMLEGDVVDKTSDSLIDSKEKLYNILIYSEIPENEAKSLTEKTFVKKDFSIIICYYKQILEEFNSIESSV